MATRVNPSDFINSSTRSDNTVNSGGRNETETPRDSPTNVILFEGACYVTSAESVSTVHYGREVDERVKSSISIPIFISI